MGCHQQVHLGQEYGIACMPAQVGPEARKAMTSNSWVPKYIAWVIAQNGHTRAGSSEVQQNSSLFLHIAAILHQSRQESADTSSTSTMANIAVFFHWNMCRCDPQPRAAISSSMLQCSGKLSFKRRLGSTPQLAQGGACCGGGWTMPGGGPRPRPPRTPPPRPPPRGPPL